jgi:NAD(P)-dependent dehydrogenase (short-subunit alcohol dehydrogenase family)
MKNALEGRTAIITGANQGLGFAIASAYIKAGASVLLCARDKAKLEEAQNFLSPLRSPNQVILIQTADVSKHEDVKRVVTVALQHFPQLHILVNNAGVYGPMGKIEDVDWENWVHAVEINLFGSILMCREVLPHFKSHHYGKIIQLSGGGATNPLPCISAYAASKAAIVRFAESLADEVRSDNINVNSIAPGPLNTRLLEEVLTAGPEKVGQNFYERSLKQKEEGGVPLERGADLAVFLASAASDGITGKLISAIWDPWENLREHLEDLKKSDVYTLRRIIPKDRGFNWGEDE